MNNKINMRIGIFAGIFLLLMSPVFAFGVSMPYMENKELYLFPGEVRNLEFILQVEQGTSETNAKAVIVEGAEIIKLTDSSDIYHVVPMEFTPVNFKITIPENAQIGDSYHVKLEFSTEAGPGSFAFGSAIEQNFDVIIGEKPALLPEEEKEVTLLMNFLIYGIITLILVIVIIIFFRIRRKSK